MWKGSTSLVHTQNDRWRTKNNKAQQVNELPPQNKVISHCTLRTKHITLFWGRWSEGGEEDNAI